MCRQRRLGSSRSVWASGIGSVSIARWPASKPEGGQAHPPTPASQRRDRNDRQRARAGLSQEEFGLQSVYGPLARLAARRPVRKRSARAVCRTHLRRASTAAGQLRTLSYRLPEPRRPPERKTWWRNFRSPWPVELVRKGRRIGGSAVVVSGDTGNGQRLAADYFTRHHGAARRAGLPRMHKGEGPTPEALQAAAASMVFVVVTPEGDN